jgi:uncharacterized membrane protein
MAALAYLLPPLTGLTAFLFSTDPRVRFHGLQSIVLGAAWPAAMYLGSFLSAGVTRVAAGVGALVWVVLLVTTAVGRDIEVPGLAPHLKDV